MSERAAVAPGGRWLVALKLTGEPGWHTYWKNPGDAGTGPTLDWKLPPGFHAGALLFPVPERILENDVAVYGYAGEVLLLTEIEAPEDAMPGRSERLEAHADWVACREICIPGMADLSLRLRIAAQPADDPDWSARLRDAYAVLPQRSDQWRLTARATLAGYEIRIAPPAGTSMPGQLQFFADRSGVIEHAAPQPLAALRGGWTLSLTRSHYAARPAERLQGLLVAPGGTDLGGRARALDVDIPVERR